MKSANLTVSPGPHRHCGSRVARNSLDIKIALLPAIVMGVLLYDVGALAVIGASMATAIIAEALCQIAFGKRVTIADGTAAVSGLVLALILPAGAPLHIVVTASALGIIIGKHCFGGLGANPLNPALVGWAIIRITAPWAGYLDFDLMLINYDTGFPILYPLAALKAEGVAALDHYAMEFAPDKLFWGSQAGGIGAASTAWLLFGGIFLVLRGIVRWEIPLFFLVGITFGAVIFGAFVKGAESPASYALFHVLTGNVMIGAFFFPTDHATTPVNRLGMIFYGLGAGLLTITFRVWSVYPDGVVFAILLMSLFVPLLDKIRARPRLPQPVEGGVS